MTWKCGIPYIIPMHPCPAGIRCVFPFAKSKADCQRPPGCLIGEAMFRSNLVEVVVQKACLGWACDHYQVAEGDEEKRICNLDECLPCYPFELFACRHPEAIS